MSGYLERAIKKYEAAQFSSRSFKALEPGLIKVLADEEAETNTILRCECG